jgi:hypothetical protein
MGSSSMDCTVSLDLTNLKAQLAHASDELERQRKHMEAVNKMAGTIRTGIDIADPLGKPEGVYMYTENEEAFDPEQVNWEALLELYGDDPVLVTLFRKMAGSASTSKYFRFKDFTVGDSTTDAGTNLRWDSTSVTNTTSTVSTPFTMSYDTTGRYSMKADPSTSYRIDEE